MANADEAQVVQQVQGLFNSYLKQRDRVAELEAELTTRREDIRRLEKQVKELQKPLPTKIAEVKD
jgi:peptidoglycan hydrolase CwlO-like protein